MSALSQSPTLGLIARALSILPIAFGINAFLRPAHALSFFHFDPPASEADRKMVDSLMAVYGARDIFMGLALFSAASLGSRKTLGCTLISTSAVAMVDGLVCYSHGNSPWDHWGYAPVLTALGIVFLGVFDRT
ncbi:hypothetical protein P175DRAFT_0518370 [Aspergillus ochraceoroseus IBT 24754]|nr:uncharacterized protein P175DRAFT_0518370 [Aspergillus ochraceoroseus IBT 24754]PTU18983.1 hypothetical protein P175DRAFT_0518370 [Aspergillus ochraceoroseus IBT 24754]